MAVNTATTTKPPSASQQQGRQPGNPGGAGYNGASQLTQPGPVPLGATPTGLTPVRQRIELFRQSSSGSVEAVRTGASEILPQFASSLSVSPDDDHYMARMQGLCRDRGITFSQLLDQLDPSSDYAGLPEGDLDGFQRQLLIAGIRTQSVPEKGIYASQVDRFFQSNVPGSQVLFPEFINRVLRQSMIAPDILPFIIATTSQADNDYYRTIYTNDTAAGRRLARTIQGAEFPKTQIGTTEKSVNLYKYGRVLEGTYEYFRSITIDLFTVFLQRIALQANLDKADTAMDVAINGDGNNNNTATNYNQSTLDTGTTPTYKAFIRFALKFYPYQLNTLVASELALVNFISMARPSVDPYQILSVLQRGESLDSMRVSLGQGIYTDVTLVYLPSVADNVLVGLDKRYALEMIMGAGANLVETDRLITSQRNQIAISEKVGFAQIFNQAIGTWTTSA